MIFNEFIWNNFKESQYGKEVIQFFLNYKDNLYSNKNVELYNKIIDSINYDTRETYDIDNYINNINFFCNEINESTTDDKILTIDDC
jgi:hypothetical protein